MWRTIFLLEYEDVALTFEVETFIIRVFDTVTSEMQSQSTIGKNFDQITICCANLPEIYLVLGRNKTMIQNVELLVVVDLRLISGTTKQKDDVSNNVGFLFDNMHVICITSLLLVLNDPSRLFLFLNYHPSQSLWCFIHQFFHPF